MFALRANGFETDCGDLAAARDYVRVCFATICTGSAHSPELLMQNALTRVIVRFLVLDKQPVRHGHLRA